MIAHSSPPAASNAEVAIVGAEPAIAGAAAAAGEVGKNGFGDDHGGFLGNINCSI